MAGLFGLFGGPQAQPPSQGQPQQSGFGNFIQNLLDPSIALPMAAQLMGQNGNIGNLGNAFAAGGQAFSQTAQKNKTVDFFRKNAPEYAAAIDSGMPVDQAWKAYTQQRSAKTADPYKSVGGHIFDTRDASFISPPSSDVPETGLTPQMMRNPDTGETIYVQATKDGRILKSQVPDGFQPYDPYNKAFLSASGNAAGKGEGEAVATYRSMMSKMPGLETVVKDLEKLADEATYTTAGQALDWGMKELGMDPRDAAVARTKYISMVDNQILPLLRDTFGAQFTKAEGDALRSTLGDPDKTPAEKKAVLKAFIEQKRRDVEALALQSVQGGSGIPETTGRASTGIQWSVGP